MGCAHDVSERSTAVEADGLCPLCLAAEVQRLTVELVNARHAIRWACGEAPDGNDQWFSDVMDEQKPGKYPRPYWWRSHLRKVAGLDPQ